MAASATIQRVAVVGANIAGARAVEALRHAGYDGRLILIGAEAELPYERPPLSKEYLLGERPEDKLFLRPAAFYEDMNVELRLGTPAGALDMATREVVLADGARVGFDRLLITTGSNVRRLPLPDGNRPGVHYLRTLADGRALAAEIRTAGAPGRGIIVGAGFIGAEVASACRVFGLDVTLIELLPLPLSRALGHEIGAIFAEIHRAHGVDLRLSEGVAEIRGTGRVEEVVTASGEHISCSFVVIGVGVAPAVEWLQGSGLVLDNGVAVDEFCESSAPGIFAAGDVASWPYQQAGAAAPARVRLEHWDNALRQGEVAARNLLGQQAPYTPVPYFWSDQYNLHLQYVGYATTWERLVFRGTPGSESWIAFYLRAGRVAAALAVNRVRDLVPLKKLVGMAVAPETLADESADLRALAAPR
ncbi:MAG TPA: FAD-dependent oxidoreductase [Ktedonobacterales bacterium]|jgi:3-phenylpropionate/trans-cinnamate dioxygenase ferredoxin reductase subunit|nr:FAD-dependent oxidoreductase [Ktedonobacterales bacterium]